MGDAPKFAGRTASALFALRDVKAPYPGLRPFEAWEAEVFFGREAHTKRLLEILRDQAFLAVIGPSGSGKSSLVRAGLIPQLPRGRLGTGSHWRVATMRPGNDPLRRLARALLQRDVLGPSLLAPEQVPRSRDEQTLGVAVVEAELRRGPLGLVQVAQMAARREAGVDEASAARADGQDVQPGFNLLVLVDQFEELFTYLDATGAGNREALVREAEAFVNLLLAAREHRASRVFVAMTMRTDFLGQCVRFLALPDAINRAQYLTPRLTWTEIRDAIVKPARHFGGDVNDTLANELINEVGTDPDQLPLLQHALSRMWEFAKVRTGSEEPVIVRQDFDDAGGVRGALSQHAELALARLSDQDKVGEILTVPQRAAQRLFLAITEQRLAEGGGQTVRRPQSLDRIVAWSDLDGKLLSRVAMHFADEAFNFIGWASRETPGDGVTDEAASAHREPDGATVIDISHEALIRQWERLRVWVQEEARRAADYRRLRDKALDVAGPGQAGAGLLVGAGLARAVEWLNDAGRADERGDDWRPTLAWASRYAADETQARAEFDAVCSYIRTSARADADAARRERDHEENLRQAEEAKRDAIAKAQLAEKERERAAAESSRASAESLRAAAEAERAQTLRELVESQEVAARRQRYMIGGLAVLLALACVLAYWTMTLRNTAVAQTKVAQARTLWSPISFNDGRLSESAEDGLLMVARASNDVTQAFLKLMHDEDPLARHFVRAPDQLLAASVGISPRARGEYLRLLGPEPPAAAASGSSRTGTPAVRALARAAARLAMSEQGADDRALAEAFVTSLAQQLLIKDGDTGESWRLPADLLLALAPQIPESRRAVLLDALAAHGGATRDQAVPWLVAGAVGCHWLRPERSAQVADIVSGLTAASAGNREAARRDWRIRLRDIDLQPGRPVPQVPLPTAVEVALGRAAGCLPQEKAVEQLRSALPAGERIRAVNLPLLKAMLMRVSPTAPAAAMEAVLVAVAQAKTPELGGNNQDLDAVRGIYEAFDPLLRRIGVEHVAGVVRAVEPYVMRPDDSGAHALAIALMQTLAPRADEPTRQMLRGLANRLPPGSFGSAAQRPWTQVPNSEIVKLRATLRDPDRQQPDFADLPPPLPGVREPNAAAAAGSASWTVAQFQQAILKEYGGGTLRLLGVGLRAKVRALPADERLALAKPLLEQRLQATDSDQQSALDEGLDQIGSQTTPAEQAILRKTHADMLADASATGDADALVDRYLQLALQTIAGDPQVVAAELPRLGARIAVLKSDSAKGFGKVLEALQPEQRTSVSSAVLEAWLKRPDAGGPRVGLRRFGDVDFGQPFNTNASASANVNVNANVLLALRNLDAGARPQWIERLLDNAVTATSDRMADGSVQAVEAMLRPAPVPKQAVAAAASNSEPAANLHLWRNATDMAAARLEQATRAYVVKALGRLIRTGLVEQQRTDAAAAADLFKLMKYPAGDHLATADALRTLFKAEGAPGADEGWWALMTWGQKRFPDLKLDAPAR